MEIMPLDDLRFDDALQCRSGESRDAVARTVEEYAEALSAGAEFPPIEVRRIDGELLVVDGHLRFMAARRAGEVGIKANVRDSDRHAAEVEACGVNRSHGLKRSNADKRNAVERLLLLEPEWSDRRIAEHVGVSKTFAGKCRPQLATDASCDDDDVSPPTRVGADGKRRKAPQAKPKPAPAKKKTPPPDEPQPERPDGVALEVATEAAELVDRLLYLLTQHDFPGVLACQCILLKKGVDRCEQTMTTQLPPKPGRRSAS